MSETTRKMEKARNAVTLLRDFARIHGMDHRERDALVMAIHSVLDMAESLVEVPEPRTVAKGDGVMDDRAAIQAGAEIRGSDLRAAPSAPTTERTSDTPWTTQHYGGWSLIKDREGRVVLRVSYLDFVGPIAAEEITERIVAAINGVK